MKPHSRKFLQDEDAVPRYTLSPTVTYSPDPLLQPMNASSTTLSKTRPFRPNSPLDFSIALTALVLLTALFFMGFFSIYIRRFGSAAAASSRRRRIPRPSYPSSSSLPPWRSTIFHKGLDPSAVRSLPLISCGGGAKQHIDCAICLGEFEEGEMVKLIPHCGHAFHPECIDTWLSSRVTCPLCRSSRLFAVEEVRSCASRGEENHGGGEDGRGSTEEMGDTWVELSEVGPLRRAYSCSSLGDQVVVQRSSFFFLTP